MDRKLTEILKSGTAFVLVLFCGFQIFRMVSAFIARQAMTKNPLVPGYLETGIRNYIIFFTVIYLIVAALNLWGWYTKKAFLVVTVFSMLIIIGIQLCYVPIVNFFLNHALA